MSDVATKRTRGVEKREKFVAFRWTPSEYEQISARAQRADLSLTEYVTRSALGELQDPAAMETRVDQLEDRIGRLEQASALGGLG